ncbi:MAG: DUF1585 domain-containing protein [bacterium]
MRTASFALLCAVALAGTAAAETGSEPLDPALCAPDEVELEPVRYLRALSLDLRGDVPTLDEIERVRRDGAVPTELIERWLDSDAFAWQAVRHHRALLWNNVDNVSIFNAGAGLGQGPGNVLWVRNRGIGYRGATVPCLDEPARFDEETGEILTTAELQPDGRTARREGWVRVEPYWNPVAPEKVCAFDAQDAAFSPGGADCSTNASNADPGCGCGPELRWCNGRNAQARVTRSMGEALDRFMFDVLRRDAPYTELFTGRKAFVNGPLSYFYTHQTRRSAGLAFEPKAVDLDTLPALRFHEERWVETELGPEHAGVLTRPAFLLRFQTNRARANRFYDAFLCQPFNPPDGGLPVADEASARNPDLQLRAGCKYCHALLEPAASHWGRWTEQGIGYLDPQSFPASREDCEACALRGQGCTTECRNFYLTRALAPEEEAFLGQLTAYQFRRPEHVRHIEQGPRYLALSAVADNRLPSCVARRTGEWLLGREMGPDDQAWIDDLARDFVQNGYSFRALVKRIVESPRYRRVR